MSEKIIASFIIEILGRPPEHLSKTLGELIDKLGSEKGLKIIDKTLHEPKKFEMKQNEESEKEESEKDKGIKEKIKKMDGIVVTNDIFTTFAEVEAEFDSLEHLLFITFNYMPSNIEIISPENFLFKNSDFSGILTGIVLRLHRYDEIAKKLTVDKKLLEEKLIEVLDELKKKG